MLDDLESVLVLVEDRSEVVGVIDEKQHVVEAASSMKVSQKPPRRLFYRGRK